jgi:thioredoxin 1
MSITNITSISQLNEILAKSNDKLTVIDFHATWCGPCHAIAPVFKSLSKQYKNANFLKCDTGAASDVAQLYRITAMPTFIFLKGKTKVDQVRGASKSELQNTVKRHASSTSTHSGAFSGKGALPHQ